MAYYQPKILKLCIAKFSDLVLGFFSWLQDSALSRQAIISARPLPPLEEC